MCLLGELALPDDKGVEPESVVLGEIDGRTYAFVGLERVGGVMVYDVTDPANASFTQYIRNEDENGVLQDLAPEGLRFISASDSPTGNPLLDAYSQYAALAQYAAQTNAAGPQQTLDMQQQQQTGEGVGRVCLMFGL